VLRAILRDCCTFAGRRGRRLAFGRVIQQAFSPVGLVARIEESGRVFL